MRAQGNENAQEHAQEHAQENAQENEKAKAKRNEKQNGNERQSAFPAPGASRARRVQAQQHSQESICKRAHKSITYIDARPYVSLATDVAGAAVKAVLAPLSNQSHYVFQLLLVRLCLGLGSGPGPATRHGLRTHATTGRSLMRTACWPARNTGAVCSKLFQQSWLKRVADQHGETRVCR